jgi:hypothetical protein
MPGCKQGESPGWIADRRRLERIIAQMGQVSAPAAEIILVREPDSHSPPDAREDADQAQVGARR